MYDPVKDGMEKTARTVRYSEAKPPPHLSGFVHCFWELRTEQTLDQDFCLHAVPDACVNILFNQRDTEIAAVTALRTKAEVLNLGKSFHYVGIQLYPGVWQGSRKEIADRFVGTPYAGELPLIQTCKELAPFDFAEKQPIMAKLIERFLAEGMAVANVVTEKILNNIDDIHSVDDMAAIAGISARQLQRTLLRTTGFSPHDLLKVLRMQQSFKRHYLDLYSDQSHFIHSFRKITGYTPSRYSNKFDV
jgi:AraC-like DNA-binding protein